MSEKHRADCAVLLLLGALRPLFCVIAKALSEMSSILTDIFTCVMIDP